MKKIIIMFSIIFVLVLALTLALLLRNPKFQVVDSNHVATPSGTLAPLIRFFNPTPTSQSIQGQQGGSQPSSNNTQSTTVINPPAQQPTAQPTPTPVPSILPLPLPTIVLPLLGL